jgi:exodeoxyribonuclease-3
MFRLLTYNIQHGGHGRLDAIAAVINSCRPDLVLLQEATDQENVKRLARATGLPDWRGSPGQSLAFMSREPVKAAQWVRPRFSRHAFIEIVPARDTFRVFGVHLSAVLAAWTEQRRVMELRALLQSVARHQAGLHVLAGDFNTIAPGEPLDQSRLPFRLRPLLWLSGGRVRWRTIQTVLDAKYVDAFRLKHVADPGFTLPTTDPHVRLDYMFVPRDYADRVGSCDVVHHKDAVRASDHFPLVADLHVDGGEW